MTIYLSRALVLPFYLFSGVLVFMILTALTKDNYFMFLFFLFLSGICIGAPYNYINAAIAADLVSNSQNLGAHVITCHRVQQRSPESEKSQPRRSQA